MRNIRDSLTPLIDKALGILNINSMRAVLALEGASGTGKTTAAEQIKAALDGRVNVSIIHTDDFFLPLYKKSPERLAQIGGNIDYERIKLEVIDHLSDEFISYGVFDCKKQKIVQCRQLNTGGLLIVEGVYSLHFALGRYYDICALLTSSFENRLDRIKSRESPNNFARFVKEWIPLENRYLKTLDTCLLDFVIET